MPIYEYECEKCHHQFEELVRGNTVPKCPKCGDSAPRRKLSVPASPHAGNGGECPHGGCEEHPHGAGCGCGGCCCGH